jgi:hypothetical protein
MTLPLYSVTLSLALLVSLFLVSLFNLKVLKPTLEAMNKSLELQKEAARDQQRLLSQALNLLSSKDPIAYQMVASVTPEPMDTSVYNGPYMTGEEYQELLNTESRMDALWKIQQEDIED